MGGRWRQEATAGAPMDAGKQAARGGRGYRCVCGTWGPAALLPASRLLPPPPPPTPGFFFNPRCAALMTAPHPAPYTSSPAPYAPPPLSLTDLAVAAVEHIAQLHHCGVTAHPADVALVLGQHPRHLQAGQRLLQVAVDVANCSSSSGGHRSVGCQATD